MMNKYHLIRYLCLCLACLIPLTALSKVSFRPLGDLPGGSFSSFAYGVSADGRVVVGISTSDLGGEAFAWNEVNGMTGLSKLTFNNSSSLAFAASADGSVIVGFDRSFSTQDTEAFIWDKNNGIAGLGDLQSNRLRSRAADVSDDGQVVVGGGTYTSFKNEAFIWRSENGMVGLGDLNSNNVFSGASGVSSNGTIVVGTSGNSMGRNEGFIWDEENGMTGLGDLPGGSVDSRATGVSADGSVVAGYSSSTFGFEPFLWNAESGMTSLGNLPGGSFGNANAISGNGLVVVGISSNKPYIWNPVNGMQNLNTVLEDGGIDLTGWDIRSPNGISYDGQTIVGTSVNPEGRFEAWVAEIPLPVTLQVDILAKEISGLAINKGIKKSLQAKLIRTYRILNDEYAENDYFIVHNLNALLNSVEALRGKHIQGVNADKIIDAIRAIISCVDE